MLSGDLCGVTDFATIDRSALKVDSLKTDLQSVEVVNELLQLGYEIVKVKPTTSADNATEVSTWIETILEKGDDRFPR